MAECIDCGADTTGAVCRFVNGVRYQNWLEDWRWWSREAIGQHGPSPRGTNHDAPGGDDA